jgi:hypothetical protein
LTPVIALADGESRAFDEQLSRVERLIVPLVEAMPVEKFFFTPTDGEFRDERPFALQVSHVGAAMFAYSARILNEKNPSDPGPNGNGPANAADEIRLREVFERRVCLWTPGDAVDGRKEVERGARVDGDLQRRARLWSLWADGGVRADEFCGSAGEPGAVDR